MNNFDGNSFKSDDLNHTLYLMLKKVGPLFSPFLRGKKKNSLKIWLWIEVTPFSCFEKPVRIRAFHVIKLSYTNLDLKNISSLSFLSHRFGWCLFPRYIYNVFISYRQKFKRELDLCLASSLSISAKCFILLLLLCWYSHHSSWIAITSFDCNIFNCLILLREHFFCLYLFLPMYKNK